MDTETIQRLFITASNQLMSNREQLVADCELMRRQITDFTKLDIEIERQAEETNVVAELVCSTVRENASTAQSQEVYFKKYDAATVELERLQGLRTIRMQQDKQMAFFIRTPKKQPEIMDTWNSTIWTVMAKKAIVHRDGQVSFVFYNGTQITVGE